MSSIPPGAHSGAGLGELLVVAITLAAIICAELALAHGADLFTRPLWGDEVFTYLLASDPGLGHSMKALEAGTDCNPPTLFLLMRAWRVAFGLSNASMRGFSIASVFAALLGIYALVRLATGRIPAAIAALALWAHPLVIHHATDARFYGPWLAIAAWLCYLLRRRAQSPSWLNAILTVLTSAGLCTIHYFGILSLALIVAAEWLFDPRPPRDRLRRLAPTLAGPAALIACIPFYLGQNQGLTVSMQAGTWVPPFSSERAHDFFNTLLAPREILMIIVLGSFFSYLLAQRRHENQEAEVSPIRWPAVAGIVALMLMPAVLIAFTLAVQSVMIPRYAMPSVLVLPVAAAAMASRMTRPVALVVCLALVASSFECLKQHVQTEAKSRQSLEQMIATIRAVPAREPVISYRRDEAYVISHTAPDLAGRVTILDYDKPFEGEPPFQLLGRDFARKLDRFYSIAPLVNVDRTEPPQRFCLIAEIPDGALHYVFPQYAARKLSPIVFEMIRVAPGPTEARSN